MGKIRSHLIKTGMPENEADELIAEAKEQLQMYLDSGDLIAADKICEEYFGLEPDYIMELID